MSELRHLPLQCLLVLLGGNFVISWSECQLSLELIELLLGLLLYSCDLFLLAIPVDAIEVSEHFVHEVGTQLISMSLSEVVR